VIVRFVDIVDHYCLNFHNICNWSYIGR